MGQIWWNGSNEEFMKNTQEQEAEIVLVYASSSSSSAAAAADRGMQGVLTYTH